jgi:hypothetical protein
MENSEGRGRLLEKAVCAVKTGRLPAVDHLGLARLWGGYGSGAPCSLCDEPVRPDEVEYEVETHPSATLRFHQACHETWQKVRT